MTPFFSVYCYNIGVVVFLICEEIMCVLDPTALCTTALYLAMFLSSFL